MRQTEQRRYIKDLTEEEEEKILSKFSDVRVRAIPTKIKKKVVRVPFKSKEQGDGK